MQRTARSVLLTILAGAAIAAETLQPPPGAKQMLEAFSDGVQVYACEAKDAKFAWVFKGPEAALFDRQGRQIGTHGRGPTWTLYDGSSVTGDVIAREPAPQQGAIPWLLLTVKSHEVSGALVDAAFIRRIDTKGGVEPAQVCDSAHEGEIARIRYSATYQFFTP